MLASAHTGTSAPRAHDDAGPGRQPARRSEIDKEAEARGTVPRPVPMEVDPTRVRKVSMSNHPGRPRAGLLAVARNDHVTPPSVYWQVTPRPRAPRRAPTKYGSGDEAAARFEKAVAQSYEVNRRCRCWAWLLWGEGGCTVRRFQRQPFATPALPLPRGGASSWASHQPVVDRPPPAIILPRPRGRKGGRSAGGVRGQALGSVTQNHVRFTQS